MENAEKIDFSERPIEREVKHGIGGAGCAFWFFGNENSADNDLKKKFEVVENGQKN